MASSDGICGEYKKCDDNKYGKETCFESQPKELWRNNGTWLAQDPRRHWEMMLHCEIAMFPRPTPNLPLPSRMARFYWHLYTAKAKHRNFYQKVENRALSTTLGKILNCELQSKDMIISEQIVKLNTLDAVGRKKMINQFEQIILKHNTLESLCLEGLLLTRVEGIRLVLALYNSRKTMKCLYCWRAFKRKEGPLLVDTGNFTGSGLYIDRIPRKCDWFRAIGCLEYLNTLSVNYAYIATPTGDLLINLAKVLGSKWQWLQLLCLEGEIPDKINPNDGVGGYRIPDVAWMETRLWAPLLKVQFIFIGLPEYDRHKTFFARHTPMHTFALSSDIDLRFQHPWFLDSTIKTLCSWYSETLVSLNLQLWHQRDHLDSQLKNLFLRLPNLQIFEFTGEIRKLATLCAMCCQVRARKCSVNCINLHLQNVIHGEVNNDTFVKGIQCLLICFKKDFCEMNVIFDIDFYVS
ncbi:hypothetical protein KPH14_008455 [Odynerus spinipes]|uniref:Uncharacterized protein n=1 Tax=Odynerus spinipes TaxID=1348599 RepID=A0AAD9RE64_9HYME|nr:hypothetical protein KPH14_008455 [Odynerus spinipes]